jgi:hypothetical protein
MASASRTRTATATHEAGHAVSALSCGLTVDQVTLSPGLTRLTAEPGRPMDYIRFKLGGPAAESIVLGGACDPLLLDSARSDRADADREAFDLTHDLTELDALVKSTLAEVTEFLNTNWVQVQRIALALISRRGVLHGTELAALVNITPYPKDAECLV